MGVQSELGRWLRDLLGLDTEDRSRPLNVGHFGARSMCFITIRFAKVCRVQGRHEPIIPRNNSEH